MVLAGLTDLSSPEVLGVIAAVALIDLGFRWMAFRQIESLAIDVALFSFALTLTEALGNNADPNSDGDWWIRTVIALVILFGLVVLHFSLEDRKQERVRKVIHQYWVDSGKVGDPALLEEVGKHAVLLALSAEAKSGKRGRRTDFADLVAACLSKSDDATPRVEQPDAVDGVVAPAEGTETNAAVTNPAVPVESDFLLDARTRTYSLVMFALLSLGALAIPLFPWR